MAFSNLFRTPLGIATVAFGVVVLGIAVAAYLLNVPLFLVLGGTLVVAALGFWLVTRKDPDATPRSDAGNPPA